MKSLRKTILYLSDTLKKSNKSVVNKNNGESFKKPFQNVDSDNVFGYQWDDSKLSNSYRAIKRLSYQKWR